MRDIPTEVIQEFLSREYRPFWLIEFAVGTSYYLTDCDVPIAVGGNLYEPRGFKIPAFRYTDKQMVDQITVTIDNLDDYFTSNFVGGSPQGETFKIRQVFLGDDFKPVSQVTGPVGYWKLDEGYGNETIDQMNNNHLTLSSGVEWATGVRGWGLEFPSSQYAYKTSPSNMPSSAITIAAWINLNSHKDWNWVANSGAWMTSAGDWLVYSNAAGNIYLAIYDGASQYGGWKAVGSPGQWIHVAGTYDGSTVKMYVNGAKGTDASLASQSLQTGGPLKISLNTAGSYFNGIIDEVFLYDRALSQDEIDDLYNGGIPGGYVGPGAILQFEGGIDAWTLDGSQLKLAAKSEMSRWTQRPLSLHSISCRWKDFKGTECTYAGAGTWCDRTYTRCVALGNQSNFGGFRWLPSIMDQEFWWGKIPK